jgi:mannan endo-1,4-beta-mannosidase
VFLWEINFKQMKNKIKTFILFSLPLLFFSYCSEDKTPDKPIVNPPKLVSSVPGNGAINVSAGSCSITLTFDVNVTCPSVGHTQISLSPGATIANVEANLKNVTILATGLENERTYQLTIPAGVILNPSKIGNEEIRISFDTEREIGSDISPVLCTENPTTEVVALYNYLKSNYGQSTISSTVAKVNWNTDEADRVNRWTGKYPKMNAFDYIHLQNSPANWIDYGNTTVVENWHNAGGIVAAMWHWNVPASESSATFSYNTNETSFRPSNALTEGTWENNVMKADLEKVANYLLLLQNENIPVIWRPLHEGAGNIYAYSNGTAWFWWGASGAQAYKTLWIYMFDYFKQKGINNMIWVWTTQLNDNAFYPGDAYVDIVGRDLYDDASVASAVAQFKQIQQAYPTKMVALAECGNVANIGEQWTAGAKWLFFMPWYDNSATDTSVHQYATKEWWQAATSNANVITR